MLSFLKRKKYKFDEYWIQKVSVKRVPNRLNFFSDLSKDKNVIHFGCTDWPIFNPNHNLHIQLSKVTKSIHGFDIDIKGIEELKKYIDQPYFSSFDQLQGNVYDLCLIPETIEHVDNIRTFLENLKYVNAKKFIITAPNCFAFEHMDRQQVWEGNETHNNEYFEIVHPDHNCWFSPYTLKNVIEKYSPLKVNQTYLLEGDRMVCCEAEFK